MLPSLVFLNQEVKINRLQAQMVALENELKELRGSAFGDSYVVVTERDSFDPIKSSGAIVFETYTGQSNIVKAVERAECIGAKYGQRWICKLNLVGTYEHCNELINQPIDQFKN